MCRRKIVTVSIAEISDVIKLFKQKKIDIDHYMYIKYRFYVIITIYISL